MNETIPVLLKLPTYHNRFDYVVNMVSESILEDGLSLQLAPTRPKETKRLWFESGLQPVKLGESDLIRLYPHLPVVILNSLIACFAHMELGFWIVNGENAIDRVNLFKGAHNDPTLCDESTWRYRIARMIGYRTMTLLDANCRSQITTFDNFIHVPSRGEVERDMTVFSEFIE
ncbi:MAG: hypothetical protein WC648_00460 [Candidatus Paceibacterota bacterium]|jgi:hypothetical protein